MRIWNWGDGVAALRSALEQGGVLAIPTESSYGLGVDPRSRDGVEAIYRLKSRDRGKPLPVVAGDRSQLELLGLDFGRPATSRLMARWPAALSLVLPCAEAWPASAGTGTLAVRIPDHARLRSLLLELGFPLTATSANPSGAAPVCMTVELARWLEGENLVVVDGGDLPGGRPSTLVEPLEDGSIRMLREGRVVLEEVKA